MKHSIRRSALLGLACISLSMSITGMAPAHAWDRARAELFAVLPDGATGPEGIAVAPDGKVYVATFGFNAAGEVPGPGKLYVYNDDGRLLRQLSVAGSSSHLLGIGFQPGMNDPLVIDFGNANVRRVDRQTGASSVFMTVSTPPASTGLNAMTFDNSGNVYVSDSFDGTIWRTGPSGGAATIWRSDPLLKTTGVPPFGANGMAFNKAGNALFVANTGNDQVIKIPVTGDAAGAPEVFVNSINGADGIVRDRHDNLWIAANQADEIVVVAPTGKAIAKLGDFDGLSKRGVPRGLLFPASLAFSRDGDWLYVANLALDLRHFRLVQTIDSQWTAQVKRYTVSKIRARIPPLHDDD